MKIEDLFHDCFRFRLSSSFDPNRGFFRLTTDQQLFPNPNVDQIVQNSAPHYFFIGRMLGKVLTLRKFATLQ
jgi:ubiquitin-protein ligase E3 C